MDLYIRRYPDKVGKEIQGVIEIRIQRDLQRGPKFCKDKKIVLQYLHTIIFQTFD